MQLLDRERLNVYRLFTQNMEFIQPSFTHPQVVANLYEFLSSDEHKRRCFAATVAK